MTAIKLTRAVVNSRSHSYFEMHAADWILTSKSPQNQRLPELLSQTPAPSQYGIGPAFRETVPGRRNICNRSSLGIKGPITFAAGILR